MKVKERRVKDQKSKFPTLKDMITLTVRKNYSMSMLSNASTTTTQKHNLFTEYGCNKAEPTKCEYISVRCWQFCIKMKKIRLIKCVQYTKSIIICFIYLYLSYKNTIPIFVINYLGKVPKRGIDYVDKSGKDFQNM